MSWLEEWFFYCEMKKYRHVCICWTDYYSESYYKMGVKALQCIFNKKLDLVNSMHHKRWPLSMPHMKRTSILEAGIGIPTFQK